MSTTLSIASVCERDIDLLLLEEFLSSPSFSTWFVQEAFGPSIDLGVCTGAQRSVTQTSGESDLEITFADSAGRKIRLLVENKIAAGFQPLQAERYHQRGKTYIEEGRCAEYRTVIVAPARYFGTNKVNLGFDSRVSYEQILDWFLAGEDLGTRRHYKAAVLRSAISKGTIGYQPLEDAETTQFWHDYWQYASQVAPRLEMRDPGPRPAGSNFIVLHPPSLPGGAEILHKFDRGFVDLQLAGLGDRLNEVRLVLGSHFSDDMELVKTGKSAAVRITVPVLTANTLACEQEPEIRVALESAMRLLDWFHTIQALWQSRLVTGGPAYQLKS